MGSPYPPVPKFRKGDLVRAKPGWVIFGWRRSTPEERKAWYSQLAEDVQAGRDVPYDSAGEPKLAPQDTHFKIPPDVVMTVLRGQVRAPHGYGTAMECCQVFCPSNGETLYLKRNELVGEW